MTLSRDARKCGGSAIESAPDRKSTRLNSSHLVISYAVFCLKKKNKHTAVIKKTDLVDGEVSQLPPPFLRRFPQVGIKHHDCSESHSVVVFLCSVPHDDRHNL